MRFKTYSGTQYILDLENKTLTRDTDKPLRHVDGGFLEGPCETPITFENPPTIGERFVYHAPPPLYWCITTPVETIFEDDYESQS